MRKAAKSFLLLKTSPVLAKHFCIKGLGLEDICQILTLLLTNEHNAYWQNIIHMHNCQVIIRVRPMSHPNVSLKLIQLSLSLRDLYFLEALGASKQINL